MLKINKTYLVLVIASYLAVLIALYFAFIYAPTEASMGVVQRIFYFHVPSAWTAFIAFFIVCFASIMFLAKGSEKWDLIAKSAAEIGVLFTTLVLITGPLWAKPVWNVFWTWDARLTTSFILWLIYLAYLMLRSYTHDKERGARFAAVFGIIGFVDVPIVYFSIHWWRTLHPSAVIGGGDGSGLAPEMLTTLMVCLGAFTILFVTLLTLRYQSEKTLTEFSRLKKQINTQ